MSARDTSSNASQDRKVTAGLRGASWNPALLPPGMKSRVQVVTTSDHAQISGCLHFLGGEKTAVMIMHPRELLLSHYMIPYLVTAGFACWTQGPRTVGNDLRLEHEVALLDVAAGAVELRASGFEHIVLLGNSGGAGLFAFYNQQAILDPANRLARTPAGKPSGLSEADMPVADAFVLLSPHPGQGKLLQAMIDPSVVDESDPLAYDPTLFAFIPENGYRPPTEGGARYAPEFISRYRTAQTARVARLDAMAREMIKQRMDAKKRLADARSMADIMISSHQQIFHVWRTDADLRCFDLSLDPSDRRFGSVWGAQPMVSNMGSVGFARSCTPESWLSTWSGLSSNASFEKCGGALQQPVLMIEYSGDNSVFPSDLDSIHASLASSDKQRHRVRGNHHGQSLKLDEPNGQDAAGALASDWLRAKFA
jgi:hypothetical protein